MKFKVKDTYIECIDPTLTVGDNKYIVEFEFDEAWEGLTKTARFVQSGQEQDVILVGDRCTIDRLKKGNLAVGVFTEEKATIKSVLRIKASILDGKLVADPLPTVYEQIIELLNETDPKLNRAEEAAARAETARDEAETAKVDAEAAKEGIAEAERNAKTSETNAALHEAAAYSDAQEAKSAAAESRESASKAESAKVAAEAARRAADNSANTANAAKEYAQNAVEGFQGVVNEKTAEAVNAVQAVIDTIPEDYTELVDEVGNVKKDLSHKADAEDLAKTDREVQALKDLTRGTAWSVVEQINEDYEKPVPSGCYKAEVQSVEGQSVVWNQLCTVLNKNYENGGITYSARNDEGTVTINGTATANNYIIISDYIELNTTHKYLVKGAPNAELRISLTQQASASTDTGRGVIFTPTLTSDRMQVRINNGSVYNNLTIKPRLFDITKLYGAGNEPTDVNDPRIKFIEQYAEEHPEYNEGEIVSTELSEVVVGGKNLLPPLTYRQQIPSISSGMDVNANGWASDYIPIEMGADYIFTTTPYTATRYLFAYDSNKKFIGYTPNTPTRLRDINGYKNARYIRVRSDEIGSANLLAQITKGTEPTAYKPYHEPQRIPFNVSLKSAGTVRDKWVDGQKDEKITGVDLGALTWNRNNTNRFYAYVDIAGKPSGDYDGKTNVICSRYESKTLNQIFAQTEGISLHSLNGNALWIYDTRFTEVTDVAEGLSGVMCYYEKATPTTAEAPALDQLFTEPNGSITFENDAKLGVKSTIEYAQNNAEV